MPGGAGCVAARRFGAGQIVDARPFAVGTLADTFREFPHLRDEIPAMGYSDQQIRDLEATLARTPADILIDATPADLARRIQVDQPIVNVDYEFAERGEILSPVLEDFIDRFLKRP